MDPSLGLLRSQNSDPIFKITVIVNEHSLSLSFVYKIQHVKYFTCEFSVSVPAKNKEQEGGNVVFDYEGTIQSITYFTKDLVEMKQAPRYGDKVWSILDSLIVTINVGARVAK